MASAKQETGSTAVAAGSPGAPRLPAILAAALRRPRWVGLLMLGLLHLALVAEPGTPLSRTLLLSHFGLFLLWQPIWRSELRLGPLGFALVLAAGAGLVLFLNWWLLAIWTGLLFGLVGGRVFSFGAGWRRAAYFLGLLYLLGTLLFWTVPQLFSVPRIAAMDYAMYYLLPALLLAQALLPAEDEPARGAQVVDLVYSVVLFLLVTMLVLGSFAAMTLGHKDYVTALLQTLFVMAALLLALGWLWNPRFGFSGLQQLFSSYLLNLGTPFEEWLTRIAAAAETEKQAAGFLAYAMRELAALPWIRGVAWQAPEGAGQLGSLEGHRQQFRSGPLGCEVATRFAPSTAMSLHLSLLAQIIGRFYEAKRREQALAQLSRLQAIYETGARLTHDVKNLLQSLYSLSSAAQEAAPEGNFDRLLRRQLPNLTQRLELALSKLQEPSAEGSGEFVVPAVWWETLKARYEGRDVAFSAELADRPLLPRGLFECVVENLIDNARQKRLVEPGLRVAVEFAMTDGVRLSVSDSGSAVPAEVAAQLFRGTVQSETGLGIGLYQAARWAEKLGYRLALAENRPGRVRFELAQARAGAGDGG